MLVEVTELMTELVLPHCDTDDIIGVERLNDVVMWYLVPTSGAYKHSHLNPYLWMLEGVKCVVITNGQFFIGCNGVFKKDEKEWEYVRRIEQRLKINGGFEGLSPRFST